MDVTVSSRLTKWNIRRLTDTQRQEAVTRFLTVPRGLGNLHRRLETFITVNDLAGAAMDVKLACLASQLRDDGLTGTTIVTYCKHLVHRHFLPSAEYAAAKVVLARIEYEYRHDVVTRAPNLSKDDLDDVIRNLTCPYTRFTVELMQATYLRVGDIAEIAPWEVTIIDDSRRLIEIVIVAGKNHRRFSHRDLTSVTVSPFVLSYIKQVQQIVGATRLVNITSAIVATRLSEAAGTKLTSYSVRNAAIHQLIEEEMNPSTRQVNWGNVQSRTKHRGVGALKSAYQMRRR